MSVVRESPRKRSRAAALQVLFALEFADREGRRADAQEVFEEAGHHFELPEGARAFAKEIVLGGPMMGQSVSNLDAPVLKGTCGVVVLTESEVKPQETYPCIKCGHCIDSCPVFLNPQLLGSLALNDEYQIHAQIVERFAFARCERRVLADDDRVGCLARLECGAGALVDGRACVMEAAVMVAVPRFVEVKLVEQITPFQIRK